MIVLKIIGIILLILLLGAAAVWFGICVAIWGFLCIIRGNGPEPKLFDIVFLRPDH